MRESFAPFERFGIGAYRALGAKLSAKYLVVVDSTGAAWVTPDGKLIVQEDKNG